MKKFFAMMLALTLVLSLGVTAFADKTETREIEPGEEFNVPITKAWLNAEGKPVPDKLIPDKNLDFDVKSVSGPVEPIPEISVKPEPEEDNKPDDGNLVYSMHIPVYENVLGCYKYTVKEKAGNTQGVDYSEETVNVEVWITNSEKGEGFVKTVYLKDANGDKIGDGTCFTNVYNYSTPDGKYKNLVVDKVVDGNLADKNQKFNIDVIFTAETNEKGEYKKVNAPIDYGQGIIEPTDWKDGTVKVTVTNSHNSTDPVTFNNIPEGVSYKVVEQTTHTDHYGDPEYNNDPATGYAVRYQMNGEDLVEKPATEETEAIYKTYAEGEITENTANKVNVINRKGANINTGIALDSMPYVIILAVAAAGVILFTVKHRKVEE